MPRIICVNELEDCRHKENLLPQLTLAESLPRLGQLESWYMILKLLGMPQKAGNVHT